ncbi:hypothetical protein Unana1_00390 [Umbelopsis nana]
MEESKFIVKSFTGSGLEYVVDIDVERSLLLSCTCADYFKNGIPCKHLYLIVRIFNVFEIKYTPDPEPALRGEDDNNNDQLDQENDPPLPAIIPPRVQLLIQAERAKEREALKRKREEVVQESFRECDARLKELWCDLMEVVEARAALLSNYEVLQLLNERMEAQKQRQKEYPNTEYAENLRTIQFEIKTALETSACSTQDEEQVENFLRELKQWKLTKAEKLQILNLRPKTPVELHILIEECEERYLPEQLEELLELIIRVLPREDDNVEEEDQDVEEEAE